MIIQLQDGRIIECTVDQYLSLTDKEVHELVSLSKLYTKDVGNPFYNNFSNSVEDALSDEDLERLINDNEPKLYEIKDIDKLEDSDFQKDDI
tara:strand:- start:205 stop:480 length:276 start_codon:yes stop_codon:yes gene_type:complete